MNINETGGNNTAFGADATARRLIRKLADGHHGVAHDAEVGMKTRRTRSINQLTTFNN